MLTFFCLLSENWFRVRVSGLFYLLPFVHITCSFELLFCHLSSSSFNHISSRFFLSQLCICNASSFTLSCCRFSNPPFLYVFNRLTLPSFSLSFDYTSPPYLSISLSLSHTFSFSFSLSISISPLSLFLSLSLSLSGFRPRWPRIVFTLWTLIIFCDLGENITSNHGLIYMYLRVIDW